MLGVLASEVEEGEGGVQAQSQLHLEFEATLNCMRI